MSAVDVDSQIASMAGLSRSGSRSGTSTQDDGAFGAMMADLGAPSTGATPRAPQKGTDTAAATDEDTGEAKAKPEANGLDDLLSQVLAGTAKTEDDVQAAHAEKGRKAKEAASLISEAASDASADAAATDAEKVASEENLQDAIATQHGRGKTRSAADAAQAQAKAESAQDTAATIQTQAAFQTAASQPAEAAVDEGETASGGEDAAAALLQAEAESDSAAVDVPTMRVKVLSRETHFAPVRTWSLATEAKRSDAEAATVAEDSTEGTNVSRSDAFAASPRERAAMRLEQARMQDPLQAGSGSEGVASDTTTAETNVSDALLGTGDASGSLAANQGTLPLASLRQVSSAIGAEVARLVDPSFTTDSSSTDSLARGNGPLRIIAIQLQPIELGTVTVRMRLGDDGLDVRISASNPATARMLQQDQARLTELLQAQGIDAATVTVTSSSDQAAAWSRFEALPRSAASTSSGQGGGDRSSGQQAGQQNSGNGRDEGEDASGGRRSRRNSG